MALTWFLQLRFTLVWQKYSPSFGVCEPQWNNLSTFHSDETLISVTTKTAYIRWCISFKAMITKKLNANTPPERVPGQFMFFKKVDTDPVPPLLLDSWWNQSWQRFTLIFKELEYFFSLPRVTIKSINMDATWIVRCESKRNAWPDFSSTTTIGINHFQNAL